MKRKYYSLKKILAEKADYNMIIGERSNGKTYAALEHIIKEYVAGRGEGAYIRRWKDDVTGKRAENVFSALCGEHLETLTNGEWDNIIYSRGGWHLARYDPDKKKMRADRIAFCHAFSLSDSEHDKSTSYPQIVNIVFDEFLSRRYYLPDEFVIFMNVLSTIIRDRDNIKIFMLGNTVNKFCPYFSEMGLHNIDKMAQGAIDVYSFGNELKIAVEYCNETQAKKSNKFFSFDNPRLGMITKGKWEIAIYPHLPQGYKIDPQNIVYSFAIAFNGKLCGCDVVAQNEDTFLFVRPKTTAVHDTELVYTMDYAPSPNVRKSFLNPIDRVDKKVLSFFRCNRVFYQSNDLGEFVRNYLNTCARE